MRALPGRSSRTSLPQPAAAIRGDAGEQRRRIMWATGELVAKRGYHDVSVELIVRRAHVGFKTFYNHFANKEAAFLALFDRVSAEWRSRIDAALAAEAGAPWPQRAAIAIEAFFDSILEQPIIARACIVEVHTVGPGMAERAERPTALFVPLLREGRQQNPRATALPPTFEETLASSVLWAAYQRLLVGDVDGLRAFVPEAVVFAMRPYLGEEEAAAWAELLRRRTSASASSGR